jgi:hypothetical protein
MDENTRAALFRRQRANRAGNNARLAAALTASPAHAVAAAAQWKPITDWLRHREDVEPDDYDSTLGGNYAGEPATASTCE